MPSELTDDELTLIDAYWRAANYLSVGQIYLYDNPLLREPLRARARQAAPARPLGHDARAQLPLRAPQSRHQGSAISTCIYVTGPGHGGPGLVANAYLEGTYSEVYPDISRDEAGMKRLFKQFSFPGGIPSHVAPETPGSIHEGGELGYALSHAFGAAFDNPNLLVACVVGDGEAETGPLATSWHSNKFLNPVRDGAVLPILHLNGYKIAGPTVLARIPRDELEQLLSGYGYAPYFVEGNDPAAMHQRDGDDARSRARRDRAHPDARRAPAAIRDASALADDRAAHAQGLDRAEGGRRQAGRRHLPRASGADRRRQDARAPARCSKRGCAATSPEKLFDADGALARRARRAAHRRARAA